MELLAQRDLLGYPGATVELRTNGSTHAVRVADRNGGKIFGPTSSRAIARDWYFHPFVYGYNYTVVTHVEDDGA